jgi:hypothetical protein
MTLPFEYGIYERILSTLDTIAIRAEGQGISGRAPLRVGRCREGNRLIPCIKKRQEVTFFGLFILYREDRVLVSVDNMLHGERMLRMVSFEKAVTAIAIEELQGLAERIGAKLQYREILDSAGV